MPCFFSSPFAEPCEVGNESPGEHTRRLNGFVIRAPRIPEYRHRLLGDSVGLVRYRPRDAGQNRRVVQQTLPGAYPRQDALREVTRRDPEKERRFFLDSWFTA
jgi:hypothetical protein